MKDGAFVWYFEQIIHCQVYLCSVSLRLDMNKEHTIEIPFLFNQNQKGNNDPFGKTPPATKLNNTTLQYTVNRVPCTVNH